MSLVTAARSLLCAPVKALCVWKGVLVFFSKRQVFCYYFTGFNQERVMLTVRAEFSIRGAAEAVRGAIYTADRHNYWVAGLTASGESIHVSFNGAGVVDL